MPAAIHTKEQIVAAGRKILESGKRVSGWGLRLELRGGRADHLMEVWQAHDARDGAAAVPEPSPPLPPELTASLDGHVGTLGEALRAAVQEEWRIATRIASDRVQREVAAAQEQARVIGEDLAMATTEVVRLEAERDGLRDERDSVAAKLEATFAELHAWRGRAEAAEASLERAAEERGRWIQRAEAAEQAMASARSEASS